MGTVPAVNFGAGMGDDYYTQMLYQQMLANGGNTTASNTGWGPAPGVTPGEATTTQKKKGISWGWTLGTGAAAAGVTYFTNNKLNSPVEEVNGNVKFNKDFMKRFSNEYAYIENGSKIQSFYNGLSNKKYPINIDNFSTTMESIEDFIKTGKVDDLTDEAKAVLTKKYKVKNANFKELSSKADDLRTFLAQTTLTHSEHLTSNNYNAHINMAESLDNIADEWKALGKGKESVAGKVEFLRKNAHTLGIAEADLQTLLGKADDKITVKSIDEMFKKYGSNDAIKTRKATIMQNAESLEANMQKLAKKWHKEGFLDLKSGFKNVGNKKTATALDNALSAMRKGKAGKYGLIAAGVTAIGSLLINA